MSYLSQADYAHRDQNARLRMQDNAEITTLTPDQHEALATLCATRHWLHCLSGDVLYNTEHPEYDQVSELVTDITGEGEATIIDLIEATQIQYDTTKIKEYMNQIELMDNDAMHEGLEEADEDTQNEMIYTAKSAYSTVLNEINNEIERFLKLVDREHETNYCPTGALRV